MKKIKSFLMVLSIIGLFVFASCKNNFTPEQVKVACNVVEKIKIKGVAKNIGDEFIPKGTIIHFMPHSVFVNNNHIIYPNEKMTVTDHRGHFESKNQYTINELKMYDLQIENWKEKIILRAEVQASTKEVVYTFLPFIF